MNTIKFNTGQIRGNTMYILLYRIETDPTACHWHEFDTFKSFDAANLIMRAGQREYPARTWMIATPALSNQ